jgi:hypothetical protein
MQREVAALQRLDHPGIVSLLGHGEVDIAGESLTWIATDYLRSAEPIIDYASGAGLDLEARTALLAEVIEALAHAHARGVIHRDLKPGNILVTPNGTPHLIDFGIARIAGTDTLLNTDTLDQRILGTIGWLTPEQVDPSLGTISPATDVYALGLIAFRLLTGEPPYETGRSLASAVQAVTHVPAADPRRLAPRIPNAVADAIAQSLGKYPTTRPVDAHALGLLLTGETAQIARPHRPHLYRDVVIGAVAILATATMVWTLVPSEPPPPSDQFIPTGEGETPMPTIPTILLASCVLGADADGILEVPNEYPTIQSAIDAAEDGQEVLVSAGTYYEHINFLGKTISVQSDYGPEVTIIDGQNNPPSAVWLTGGEGPGTALIGFTIINGRATTSHTGGGVHVSAESSLQMANCVIRDCSSPDGGGILVVGSYTPGRSFVMEDCLVTNCSATHSAGLAWIRGSEFGETRVERCDFVSGGSYNGAVCAGGPTHDGHVPCDVLFKHCNFEDGSGSLHGGLTIGQQAVVQVEGCTFRNNNSGGTRGDAITINCFYDGGHGVIQNCVFIDNGSPTCGHINPGETTSAQIFDSVFCGNDGANLNGPWELDNVLELNGCPEDLDCNEDGVVDWIQCVTHPETDLDGDWIPDECQDCDNDGISDAQELEDGALDCNENGLPDECDCIADIVQDGAVGVDDLLGVIGAFGSDNAAADINCDGTVGVDDVLGIITDWGPCPA